MPCPDCAKAPAKAVPTGPKQQAKPVAWFKHGPYGDGEPLSVIFEDPQDNECYSALVFADLPEPTQAGLSDKVREALKYWADTFADDAITPEVIERAAQAQQKEQP